MAKSTYDAKFISKIDNVALSSQDVISLCEQPIVLDAAAAREDSGDSDFEDEGMEGEECSEEEEPVDASEAESEAGADVEANKEDLA